MALVLELRYALRFMILAVAILAIISTVRLMGLMPGDYVPALVAVLLVVVIADLFRHKAGQTPLEPRGEVRRIEQPET